MHLRIAAIALVVILAGCAGKPFVADSLSVEEVPGRRVAVLPVNFIEKPSVEVVENIVGFAGTAGKIAVIKGRDTKRRKFHEALVALEFSYQDHFDAQLISGLNNAGYEATSPAFRRTIDNILEAVPPGRFEKRPRTLPDADMILDVYVAFVGYAAPSLGKDYQPTFHIGTRLLHGESLAVLYQSEIQYHAFDPEGHEVTFDPPADGAFESFDDIMADVPGARDGLVRAIDTVVDQLIADLDFR